MNSEFLHIYSFMLKTAGFWLILLATIGDPNPYVSAGAVMMLAAWYLKKGDRGEHGRFTKLHTTETTT